MKSFNRINGKSITTLPAVFILIVVIGFSSFGALTLPLYAKGVGDSIDSGITVHNPDIEKEKEEERKAESEKRAYQDQQNQQRIQKEKEDQRIKDEAKKKEDERRENERREREAQEARNREEQQRRDQEAQRKQEEADRIAEQRRQEQDRQYREDQQRQEKIRQEQERASLEQQAQAAQDEQNRIAIEEQLRHDKEARDAQERQNRIDNLPIDNQQDSDQDLKPNNLSTNEGSETQDNTALNNHKHDPNAAFQMHYSDPFFYPYDKYSYANYPYDNSSYTINLPKPVKKAPAKIRKGSADEAMFDINYAWRNRSLAYLIKHTTKRIMIKVYYNSRYSHTMNQKQFFELTKAAFINTKTHGMKFSSIKKTSVTLYFKLKHDFYDPDEKLRQVYLAYYMKKINGVWLFQRIDITRNKK